MNRATTALLVALAWLAAAPALAQSGSNPTAILQAPRTVAFGAPLTLSGTSSFDSDGTVTRYVWTKLTGSGGGMPLNQAFGTLESTYLVPQPAGSPLAIGRHRFRLAVNDNSGNFSQPVEVEVIVADNSAPTAVLEGPKQVMQVQPFQLSAMRSSDIGGRITQYRLSRISGSTNGPMPLGQEFVTEANVFAVTQSLTSYLGVGRHVFRVVAVDDSGNQSKPAEFAVEVSAPLPSGRSQ